MNKKAKICFPLAFAIAFSPLALQSEAIAIQAPFFSLGICEFDGSDYAPNEIIKDIPDALCSISISKKFDSIRYIIKALDDSPGTAHWLWRSGPGYVAKVSPKSNKICKSDASDRRRVIGLKPGKCVVTLVTRKAKKSTPIDNTNKGDFYTASVVIIFTK